MGKLRRVYRFLLGAFCVLVIFASTSRLTFWYYFDYKINDLPTVEILQNYNFNLPSVVYGDNGKVIDKFVLQERDFTPFYQIPENVKKAIVAAEDKNFWSDRWIPGIDIGGIIRAGRDDLIATMGKSWHMTKSLKRPKVKIQVVAGGSTITQQVAKLVWLSQEKTASRKIKETRIAYQMEKRLPKDLIFEIYANMIYMGHNHYGIAAGARFYFDKTLDQLSISEAAMLAGLVKWPYQFSPFRDIEIATDRRNTILVRMVRAGFVSENEFQNLKEKKLVLASWQQKESAAPYFSEFLMGELHKLGYDSVVSSGLKIYTTINPEIQKIAVSALKHGLETHEARHKNRLVLYNIFSDYELKSLDEFKTEDISVGIGSILNGLVVEVTDAKVWLRVGSDKALITSDSFKKIRQDVSDLSRVFLTGDIVTVKIISVDSKKNFLTEVLQPRIEGAIVVLDVETGAVKAIVGGRDFAVSRYNRALQAERQAGSAFKPFVYGAYFEKYPEYDLESPVLDAPICFKTGNSRKPKWCPKNYKEKSLPPFMGSIPIRIAIARSRNVATVRVADFVGINEVVDLARGIGITSEIPRYLPTAIGAADVKVIDMARAYSAFFRQGKDKTYWFLSGVCDKKDECRNLEPNEEKQVITPNAANKILEAMRWVTLAGTARSASRELSFAVAGKTGTTNNFTDAWFVGGTSKYVVAIWVGFDQKAIPLVSREASQKETGGSAALPIFIDIMKGIYKDGPYDEFPEEIENHIKEMQEINKKSDLIVGFLIINLRYWDCLRK